MAAPRKPRKPRAAKPKPVEPDPVEPVQLESVYGPFESRVMVSMTARQAEELFGPGEMVFPMRVVAAAERELAALRLRDEGLADSSTAAGAVAMAVELDNPHNSATSKSMCRAQLASAMAELRELAPPVKKGDAIDDLADGRRAREAAVRLAATSDSVRS